MNLHRPRKSRKSKKVDKRKILYELCGGCCPNCGRQLQNRRSKEQDSYMTIDHIVPKSYAGSNHLSNLQPLCRKCNMKKSDH